MSEETRNTAAAADPPALKATPVLDYRSVPPPQGHTIEMTARTIRIFQQTFLWAAIIAGLMLVGGALLLVIGFCMLVGGGQPVAAVIIALAGLSLVVPSIFLSRYAKYIHEFGQTPNGRLLEKAFESSWMFWKLLALAMVVVPVVVIVMLAFMATLRI